MTRQANHRASVAILLHYNDPTISESVKYYLLYHTRDPANSVSVNHHLSEIYKKVSKINIMIVNRCSKLYNVLSTYLHWSTGHDSATFHNRTGRAPEYLGLSGKAEHDRATFHNRTGRAIEYLGLSGKAEHDRATILIRAGRTLDYLDASGKTVHECAMSQDNTGPIAVYKGPSSTAGPTGPQSSNKPTRVPLTIITKTNKPIINPHPPGFEPGPMKLMVKGMQPVPLSYRSNTKKRKLRQLYRDSTATQGNIKPSKTNITNRPHTGNSQHIITRTRRNLLADAGLPPLRAPTYDALSGAN